MSSRFEGFGMVLIEAMSCGVPCVSFDCPFGPSDVIKNSEDGFLIDQLDINGMAEKIMLLMKEDKKRKTMGRLAKKNVMRFSPEVIVKQWNSLFKSL